jgi:cobalt/nickel transport system ATP-binding protein
MTQTASAAILGTDAVSFRYPDGSRGLTDCSIGIARGSRTAILGANGAGKTTLFLQLNGILRPQSGTILYDGQPLDYSRGGLRRLRSRVGLVFQNPDNQLFSASVREDISFGPMNLGLDVDTVRERVESALQSVAMADKADKPVHNLSYGQKKRVCIAGVLAMRPEVLILDEPMAGLDFQMQRELLGVLESLHKEGMTIIIATHDIDFAWQWGDSLVLMADGRCTGTLSPADSPHGLEKLAAAGYQLPSVARLYTALQSYGTLPPAGICPRTVDELIISLAQGKN